MNRSHFCIPALCVVILGLSSIAMAKTYHLTSTPLVPAATGDVDVSRDQNGNFEIQLKVSHLAKPGVLTPPATAYIVWFQEQGSEPESQGELRVDDNLKGELKTSTPFHNFDVFVTAEGDKQARTPSGRMALRSSIQEPKK
jgi:hypothetical protein